MSQNMSTEEKAEMLFEVTKLVTNKLSNTIEELKSYFHTYPELSEILTLIVDVSILDEKILQVIVGRSKCVQHEVQILEEQVNE